MEAVHHDTAKCDFLWKHFIKHPLSKSLVSKGHRYGNKEKVGIKQKLSNVHIVV